MCKLIRNRVLQHPLKFCDGLLESTHPGFHISLALLGGPHCLGNILVMYLAQLCFETVDVILFF